MSRRGRALFITGANSDYVGPASHAGIARLFPQSRLEQVADAGHWVHADQPGALIPGRLAREMVRPQNGLPVGLGPQLAGSDHDPRFFHSGGNRGFNCRCVGFVEHADGVVVMTNGPFSAAPLLNEVIGAIGASRGWLDFVVPQELKVLIGSDGLEAFVGAYEVSGMTIGVRLDEDGLRLDGPFGPQLMHRTGEREFVLADATRVTFRLRSIRQTWPVLLPQSGSLAYRVPSGAMARSLGWCILSLWAKTVIFFVSGSMPSSASRVSSAKSKRSIGLDPSLVSSVPMRPSSSKPAISWQPAQP